MLSGFRKVSLPFNLGPHMILKSFRETMVTPWRNIEVNFDNGTFYLDDDGRNPVDFNAETITFGGQLMKM